MYVHPAGMDVLESTLRVHPRWEALDWHSCSNRCVMQSESGLIKNGCTGGGGLGGGDGGGLGGGVGGGTGGERGRLSFQTHTHAQSVLFTHDSTDERLVL